MEVSVCKCKCRSVSVQGIFRKNPSQCFREQTCATVCHTPFLTHVQARSIQWSNPGVSPAKPPLLGSLGLACGPTRPGVPLRLVRSTGTGMPSNSCWNPPTAPRIKRRLPKKSLLGTNGIERIERTVQESTDLRGALFRVILLVSR